MIFKIEIELKDIEKYIKIFSKDFDLLYCKNLYIALKNSVKKITISNLKKKYKIDSSLKVLQINENNLAQEDVKVINWCRDKFVLQDLNRFEIERQEEIKQYLKFLDSFEEELKKI